jgi:hypothetical protein
VSGWQAATHNIGGLFSAEDVVADQAVAVSGF